MSKSLLFFPSTMRYLSSLLISDNNSREQSELIESTSHFSDDGKSTKTRIRENVQLFSFVTPRIRATRPEIHAGTRPRCRFSACSESSLDTYRIIAARLPFYNSRGISGNTRRILIFQRERTDAAAARLASSRNPPETPGSALSLFAAYISAPRWRFRSGCS